MWRRQGRRCIRDRQPVARILVGESFTDAIAARVGGDEFLVIFDGLADRRRLADIADRIISRVERPMLFDGQQCRISGSIGITLSRGRETLPRIHISEPTRPY